MTTIVWDGKSILAGDTQATVRVNSKDYTCRACRTPNALLVKQAGTKVGFGGIYKGKEILAHGFAGNSSLTSMFKTALHNKEDIATLMTVQTRYVLTSIFLMLLSFVKLRSVCQTSKLALHLDLILSPSTNSLQVNGFYKLNNYKEFYND